MRCILTQMFRNASLFLVILVLVASCSSDSDGSSGESGAPDAGASTASGETSADSTTSTTLPTFTPAPEEEVETPFSLPPFDTDEIDVMLEEALDDDEVTADELAAVLVIAGVAPDVAECEAEILIELGVEDVGGAVELQRAVEAMTPEITARLTECLQA